MARCLMVRIIVSALIIIFFGQFNATQVAVAGPANANSLRNAPESASSHANEKIAVTVKGSSCVSCIKSLQKAIAGLDGVKSVDVEADALKAASPEANPKPHKSKRTAQYLISYDSGQITASEIETFIKGRDFQITSVRFLGHG